MKVCILCGGKGTRLRPQIEEIPKTLVKINGKPILEHNINLYSNKGHKKFILCIGYKGELIVDYIKNSEFHKDDIDFEISQAGVEASMLKRIYDLKESVNDILLVSYGDTLTNIDVEDLKKTHIKYGKLITIVVTEIKNPFGLVKFNECNEVVSFVEKPLLNYYIGMFIMNKYVFDIIQTNDLNKPDGEGLVSLFHELVKQNELMTYVYKGKQITFNTYKELTLAEEQFKSFFTL